MSGKNNNRYKTFRVEVKGLVQGVGFRPFIYRLASGLGLSGSVENRNDGVSVLVNCDERQVEQFVRCIRESAPPASNIESVAFEEVPLLEMQGFQIVKSRSFSDTVTDVSPDIAVCDDCLGDMKTQSNRIDYPFVNCTNCGPRFTIIKDLPYDREKTTMRDFRMCSSCRGEYDDITDRRFHAQPVACADCGPRYHLHLSDGSEISDQRRILETAIRLMENRGIVAIKGLGGYFLACDAFSREAVARLRKLKAREGKPLAVMFSGISTLSRYAHAGEQEKKSLLSLKRPIVLLGEKAPFPYQVNAGFDTIGAMLPYMPFHYLMFENSRLEAIVMTSGNISDEPIITTNSKAVETFGKICDAVLTYNREIYNRTDDSVVRVINGKERVFRRSRGYAPVPVNVSSNVEGLLATGGELSNCFCIGKGSQAILSQHIGDLKNIETWEYYTETIEKYKKLFRFKPSHVVTDMHPDYLSTRYSDNFDLPVFRVQHHHAHIASSMACHGLDETVTGVAMDGTGYGDDGNIWGSEFLVCDLEDYRRVSHFEYMPMPGGDRVAGEPWRMGVSLLYKTFGKDFTSIDIPFIRNLDKEKADILCRAMDEGITPLSAGAGRLFDGVSALTGLCVESSFHAEAPMRLESALKKGVSKSYKYITGESISFTPAIEGIVKDLTSGVPVSVISARFHNTVIDAVVNTVSLISRSRGIKKVVLSGGTFQNAYLTENIEKRLKGEGFRIFPHLDVPANDGGIALGQLIVGAEKRRRGKQ